MPDPALLFTLAVLLLAGLFFAGPLVSLRLAVDAVLTRPTLLPVASFMVGVTRGGKSGAKAGRRRPAEEPASDPVGHVAPLPDHVEALPGSLSKPWWQSRGIMGPVIAVMSLVAGWFGLDVDHATQAYLADKVVVALTAAGVLAGAVTGIIGRLRATHVIR